MENLNQQSELEANEKWLSHLEWAAFECPYLRGENIKKMYQDQLETVSELRQRLSKGE
jgi:hypothetical protein